jgi:predicted N-acetyltransferase YhbS
MIVVRSVEVSTLIDLRHRVLLPGEPRATAFFEGDHEPTTLHFGAFDDARLVGCVTIMHRPFGGSPAWQLRGMAVESDVQRLGVGARLIGEVDAVVASHTIRLMWCNARSPAIGFYARHGWEVTGEEFVIPIAGPHRVMVCRKHDRAT